MENEEKKPDIFDRIMHTKLLRPLEGFYKAHKEVLLYLFFGGCTTLVSIIFFALPMDLLRGKLPEISLFGIKLQADIAAANVISWICAVTFAYITNRIWVFENKAHGAKKVAAECAAFFAGRLLTLLIETALLELCITKLSMGDVVAKIIVSVVTIILNYVISKLFVFRKRD